MRNRPATTIGQQSVERKRLLSTVTREQIETCKRDYRQHLATCAKLDATAAPFDIFLIEWLECARGDQATATTKASNDASSGDDSECVYEGHGRNYERLYEGKRGWD